MHPTSERFCGLLDEMRALHLRKAADYGTDDDPLANLRQSADFGVAPWLATAVRFNDKVTRLKTFAQKGTLCNEGVEDTLLDMATYALLILLLFRETVTDPGDDAERSDDIDLQHVPLPDVPVSIGD